MAYNYTKKFLEFNCKQLERGLEIDDKISSILDGQDELTKQQFQQILRQVNVRLKRHHRNMFSTQATSQIAQQVVKYEQTKAIEATEKLLQAQSTIQPLILPELETALSSDRRLAEFKRLVDELPESRYLQDENMDEELLDRYESVRQRMVQLNERFVHAYHKRDYLKQLLGTLGNQEAQENAGDLEREVERFQALVKEMKSET
ncbi:hypothetical protein PGUG_04364 [Meyerozyma guilliermondii ATCC 6260]|uniref:Uncharacterized protein n=1 Tax=Meyerozyma guilliermondii (strain ATCC 6260 / CBS 566 / DSM 6381 / JCM 1539 / NBRC 10279 / NRRL Y-324) TaxID=294746 RepID=A5DM63_PICGU|nr:uncharacterized protein PGUG_04364 [Meyerozyma guilliermondii ATCC 6260]EDK40266.2 hypothetical protein PGUG_04364 [Meyerozyma guilliermondii ATCC 6260]